VPFAVESEIFARPSRLGDELRDEGTALEMTAARALQRVVRRRLGGGSGRFLRVVAL
jgi:hypothetical protein